MLHHCALAAVLMRVYQACLTTCAADQHDAWCLSAHGQVEKQLATMPAQLSGDKNLELNQLANDVARRLQAAEEGRGELGTRFLKR